jgi:hypothetical protein
MNRLKRYLKWFHNDSASVLGMRSNYFTILNTAYGSMPFTENESIMGNLKKIREHRLVYQAMRDLDRTQIRYLSAIYQDEYQNKYPLVIKHVFYDKTGLALCLSYDMKELMDLCVKHRQQALSPEEAITLNKLITITDEVYAKLHKALQYNSYIMELNK